LVFDNVVLLLSSELEDYYSPVIFVFFGVDPIFEGETNNLSTELKLNLYSAVVGTPVELTY